MLVFSIVILLIGATLLILPRGGREKNRISEILNETNPEHLKSQEASVRDAVDYNILMDQSLYKRLKIRAGHKMRQIGSFAFLKILFFYIGLFAVTYLINDRYMRGNLFILFPVIAFAATIFMSGWLTKREMTEFENAFPDALGLLVSAVTAGDSISHAISFVGESLESDVGKEFKWMGERLKMGESTDVVLSKACEHYPYPSFVFFVITIRANISRGGQLKQVIMNLNRIMFDARATQKKKLALTSEARVSAKIVGAIPFIFLVYMQFAMPDAYEFVMFTEQGHPFLYYLIISECMGFATVKLILSGV